MIDQDEYKRFEDAFFRDHPVETIKENLFFDQQTEQELAKLAPIVEEHIEFVIDGFYGHILAIPDVLRFFKGGMAQVKALQNVNRKSLVQCFKPPFDRDYFADRIRVGFAHYKAQLPPELYFGSIIALEEVFSKLWYKVFKKPHDIQNAHECTKRQLKLETYLTLEAYFRIGEQALEAQNRMTKEILDNLSEGFLTVESNLVTGPIASASCLQLFGQDVTNKKFTDILPFSEERNKFLGASVEQIFDNFMPIEVTISMIPGQIETNDGRFFQLSFTPIFDNGNPVKLIFTVRDVTEMVSKQREYEAKAQYNATMVGILKDRGGFADYIEDCETELQQLAGTTSKDLGMRILHTLKGNSAAFGLTELAEAIHELESAADKEKNPGAFFKKAAKSIHNSITRFLEDNYPILGISPTGGLQREYAVTEKELTELRHLSQQTPPHVWDQLATILDHISKVPISTLFTTLGPTVERLGERLDKNIKFKVEGGEVRVHPETIKPVTKQLIHAIRNACDHGIEPPDERADQGKDTQAEVKVRVDLNGENMVIVLEDDGRGINTEKLAEKAASRGFFTEAEIEKMTDAEKFHLIFLDGVSSRDQATDVSGRGVGMAALKAAVEDLGGGIDVSSESGKGTQIRLFVPFAERKKKITAA